MVKLILKNLKDEKLIQIASSNKISVEDIEIEFWKIE